MRYLLILLLLSSCATYRSANWNIQRAKYHKLIAISKGAKVESDTVYIDRDITNKVPGDSLIADILPEIDQNEFGHILSKNDSLVLVIDSLKKLKQSTVIQEKKIIVYRDRLAKGFSKDSTYVFKPDSVTLIKVSVKSGLLSKIDYKRKETSVTQSHKLPVLVEETITTSRQWWEYALAIWFILGVGFVLGWVFRYRSRN